MVAFLAGRLAQGFLTLWLVSVVVFVSTRLTGSPETVMLSPDARPEDFEAFRQAYGLHLPIHEQYLRWAQRAVAGDLGRGIHFAVPVLEIVGSRLGNSLALAGVAVVFALLAAFPLGVLAATKRGQAADRLATALAAGGQAIPSFWLAMVLVLILSVNLRLLPATGASTWAHFILPGVTIGYFIAAGTMRLIRSNMLEVLGMDYIKFARAKGLPERLVVWKHALRNALVGVATYIGYMFGAVIAASITVETVFNWPGIGTLVYEAIRNRDFPVVQGVVLVWSALVLAVNMLIDVFYLVLDPRVRRV